MSGSPPALPKALILSKPETRSYAYAVCPNSMFRALHALGSLGCSARFVHGDSVMDSQRTFTLTVFFFAPPDFVDCACTCGAHLLSTQVTSKATLVDLLLTTTRCLRKGRRQ